MGRLKAALPLWLPFYEQEHGPLEEPVRKKLLQMSAATIDRRLKKERAWYRGKGLCGTRPGGLLKHQIPIRTDNDDVGRSCFLEADTVAHCGNSLAGDFIWSVTFTDIFCQWTENRAVWNRGAAGVLEQVKRVDSREKPLSPLGKVFPNQRGGTRLIQTLKMRVYLAWIFGLNNGHYFSHEYAIQRPHVTPGISQDFCSGRQRTRRAGGLPRTTLCQREYRHALRRLDRLRRERFRRRQRGAPCRQERRPHRDGRCVRGSTPKESAEPARRATG